MFTTCIYVIECVYMSFLFCGWRLFLDRLHFVYSSASWWKFGLLPVGGYYNIAVMTAWIGSHFSHTCKRNESLALLGPPLCRVMIRWIWVGTTPYWWASGLQLNKDLAWPASDIGTPCPGPVLSLCSNSLAWSGPPALSKVPSPLLRLYSVLLLFVYMNFFSPSRL